VSYLGDVADALDYLGQNGAHHRQLSPLHLTKHGARARVGQYIYFGPPNGFVLGQPQYPSPEELRGQGSAASSQWKLGSIYFHMRTGRPPYSAAAVFELVQRIMQGPPDLSPLAAAERPALSRALVMDPAERFGSCAELIRALKRAIAPACARRTAPFHAPERTVRAWNNDTVRSMARAIDDNDTFERLPILADALEDAGCTDVEQLEHLRGPGPHVRGCWALVWTPGKC
jgi:serine/threonine protein kinase